MKRIRYREDADTTDFYSIKICVNLFNQWEKH